MQTFPLKKHELSQVQNVLSTYLLIQKKSIFGVVFFEELGVLRHAANVALQQGLVERHENPRSTWKHHVHNQRAKELISTQNM